MTPSPPDEAIHFRGETLTPESPRPLHVPEPANIPVLQNQMDPVFNDTSTYEKPQSGEENAQPYDGLPSYASFPGLVNGRDDDAGGSGQETGSFHSGSQQVDGSMNRNDTLLSTAKNAFPSDHSSPAVTETAVARDAADPSLTALPSDPAALLEKAISSEIPSSQQAPPVALDAAPAPTALPHHNVPTASEVDAAPPSSNEHDDGLDSEKRGDAASNGAEEGVDFQNLLDNLSPSASTAPSGPAVTATTTSPADDSAPPQAMTDRSLPTHMGLPPRPPPQEKPSIHPNYTPSDDIRSYHLFPQQANTSAAYATQQSNYPPSSLPPLVSAPGAPGTSSGANGLPPPPVATFQQSQPPAGKPQEAATQPGQKNNKPDRQSARSDDDAPWGPEVQKKYDEFLHDERVYVTEGLWDRFPPGSRLFVGQYTPPSLSPFFLTDFHSSRQPADRKSNQEGSIPCLPQVR